MEPPIGYGWTHRSIFSESHFRTATGSDFDRLGVMGLYDNSPMNNTLLIIGLGITACAPMLHPITPQPAIVDPNDALHFCLDYTRRAVPASGLAEAVAMGGTRQAVFDRCLAAQGWAE
jgi:hypothetical protein